MSGATSKLCGPVPKNMTATTTVTAIIMPEPMSPTASRARSPRANSMPSAGTSGNRVRKYSSVIPSLPHAKTLNQHHVIAQIGRYDGESSVNCGVLDVRGKGLVRRGVKGGPDLSRRKAHVPLRTVYWPCWRMPRGARGQTETSHRQEKCAPVGAPSRSLFRLLDARLATTRLIDQRVRTAVAILAAPRLDRRLAGNLVLDHGLTNR